MIFTPCVHLEKPAKQGWVGGQLPLMILKNMTPTGTRNLDGQSETGTVGSFHDDPLHSFISSLYGISVINCDC